MPMMQRLLAPVILLPFLLLAGPASAGPNTESAGQSTEKVLDQLRAHYGGKNFTADFRQESTLEAMDITDTARGRVWFKHPGRMRWAYEAPEKYLIVTDSQNLWIYRPADNQVVVGDARQFFGDGRGASFLADFGKIPEVFDVRLADSGASHWRLQLTPQRKSADLQQIFMKVDRQSLAVDQVTTENVYGDKTRIFFDNFAFKPEMENDLFDFQIPAGADIIEMEE